MSEIKPVIKPEDKKYFVAYWENHEYTMGKDGQPVLIRKTTSEDINQ